LPWTSLARQKLPFGQSELSSQKSCLGAAGEAVGNNGIKTTVKVAKANICNANRRSV